MSTGSSYWQAFLLHPVNRMVVLGITSLGVLASFPLGWPGMALALFGLAAVEVAGVAIVPSLPPFRSAIDRQRARADRESRRQRLLQEIELHGNSSHMSDYGQMQQRVASLYRMAQDATTTFGEREVEQLDDLTVRYLNLCLSDAVMHEENNNANGTDAIQKKLRAIEQRLAQPLPEDEKQQLAQARGEYQEALKRQARMASRRSTLEASLVAMPLRMEEVYQMVMTAPSAGNLGALLEESVLRLRTAEQVTFELEEPLASPAVWNAATAALSVKTPAARAPQATRQTAGNGSMQ